MGIQSSEQHRRLTKPTCRSNKPVHEKKPSVEQTLHFMGNLAKRVERMGDSANDRGISKNTDKTPIPPFSLLSLLALRCNRHFLRVFRKIPGICTVFVSLNPPRKIAHGLLSLLDQQFGLLKGLLERQLGLRSLLITFLYGLFYYHQHLSYGYQVKGLMLRGRRCRRGLRQGRRGRRGVRCKRYLVYRRLLFPRSNFHGRQICVRGKTFKILHL